MKLAQEQIALGKPISKIKDSLDKAYKAEHRDAFYVAKREDYDNVYKLKEIIQETTVFDEVLQKEIITTEVIGFDYLDDAPTYEEYRDETTITQNYIEAIYDVDGITILTPEVLEVKAQVRPNVPQLQADVDTLVNNTQELVDYQAKIAKEVINTSLGKLTVVTALGKEFDATLEARQNLADAILASGFLGLTETTWRLADNSEVVCTLVELSEAHAMALQAYAITKSIGA